MRLYLLIALIFSATPMDTLDIKGRGSHANIKCQPCNKITGIYGYCIISIYLTHAHVSEQIRSTDQKARDEHFNKREKGLSCQTLMIWYICMVACMTASKWDGRNSKVKVKSKRYHPPSIQYDEKKARQRGWNRENKRTVYLRVKAMCHETEVKKKRKEINWWFIYGSSGLESKGVMGGWTR